MIVQDATPLSRSHLWTLQRAWYERAGIAAWSEGTVPHYVTSNPFIARSYARVVRAWLEEIAVDPGEPVHLFELGAGSGRFGFAFLKALLPCRVPVRYVLTDMAERNIAFWRTHPALRPFVDAGVLDFARFDADQADDEPLTLLHAGRALGALRNPAVVIANYFFDTIRQDAFTLEDGVLHDCRVALESPQDEPDPGDPAMLPRLVPRYSSAPATPYGDPELDGIRGESTFPVGALRVCQRFRALSGGRMLLLSADKGDVIPIPDPPALAIHGSFSLRVNYHAIGAWFRNAGGEMLVPSRSYEDIAVVAAVLGCPAPRAAYVEAIDSFGPDDFFTLKSALNRHLPTFSAGQLLAWLRVGGGDQALLCQSIPLLIDGMESVTPRQRQDLLAMVEQVWESYYHLDERRDLPFELGTLLTAMGCYLNAISYFQRSIGLYGVNAATCYNMSLCHYHLEDRSAAARWARDALDLEPAYEAALEMMAELELA